MAPLITTPSSYSALPHTPFQPLPSSMPLTHDLTLPKFAKLEFPQFDGKEDPLAWITRCEQFFKGQGTPETSQVWLASFHLTGDAHLWYHKYARSKGRPTWELFKTLCHNKFGQPKHTNQLEPSPAVRSTVVLLTIKSASPTCCIMLLHSPMPQRSNYLQWACRSRFTRMWSLLALLI
jgi:hypothetical protein